MDIKQIVNELVNKITKKEEPSFSPGNYTMAEIYDAEKEEPSFSPENYTMAEIYDAEKLVVGKFEYISSDVTEFGPMVKKTSQNYIFEPIVISGMVKYQEVFTGFIAGDSAEGYFDLPYVVEMEELTKILVDYKQTKIPRLGMLLTLNEVNSQMVNCNDKHILNR